MTYGLTPAGFVRKPFATILAEIHSDYRGKFGNDIDLSAGSAFGNRAAILAEREDSLWKLAEAVYAAFDPDQSEGDALEAVGAITGAVKRPPRKTVVNGVVLQGTPGTVVERGKVASIDGSGARFALAEAVLIGAGGTAVGVFEAEAYGLIPCYAGTLTKVETPVAGWESVANPIDGVIGAELESDPEFRTRRAAELTLGGSATVEAIRADMLEVDGITSCRVFENKTSELDVVTGMPPKSIEVLVTGGDDQVVADAIWKAKPSGILTWGTIAKTVVDSNGDEHEVRFSRPTMVPTFIFIPLEATDEHPEDGESQIKAAVVAWGARTLLIGDDLYASRIFAPVLSIPGLLDVGQILVGRVAPAAAASVAFGPRELADFDTSRIVVAYQ